MRFSEHSTQLMHSCPLKYELLRGRDLGAVDSFSPEDMDANPDIDFGKALGVGFQSLLKHKDIDRAIFDAACAYGFWESDKKCWEGIVAGIQVLHKTFPLDLFTLVLDEASIKLKLGSDDFWCGFVDGILYRKDTGKYIIGEIKSCGQNRDDLAPVYQNSGQALGYSVALPEIIGGTGSHDFDVMYIVAHLPGQKWFPQIKTYTFEKTKLDRLKWLLGLQLDYETYCRYRDLQVFPARGSGCMAWNRVCGLFGVCNTLTPSDFPPREPDKIDLMPDEDWDICMTLDNLIEKEVIR